MSEAHAYAVASGKGGVGKTTTALALGACAAGAGHDAVVVDADLGMANVTSMLDLDEAKPTLHAVLAGDADLDTALRDLPAGFDVLPGGTAVDDYAAADPAGLGEVMATLRGRYETIVIDTGAGLSHETVLPTSLADETVLVTTADEVAVGDTAKTLDIVERLGGSVSGAIVTRAVEADAEEVADALSVSLLGLVPEDDAVRDAAAAGEPVPTFAPDSPAARAYCDIAAGLFGVAVGDIDVGGTGSPEGGAALVDDAAEPDEPAEEETEESGGFLSGLFG